MSRSASHRTFRTDIQGMRGLAVLLVVLFHAGWISGGFVGVDVFFVISGYLIGGLLLKEAHETGRINLLSFSSRRIRRLLPALAATTTATVILALFIVDADLPLQATIRTAIAASLIGANVSIYRQSGDYFSPLAEENPLLHTWSLSLEEQFYIAAPLLFLICLRFGDPNRARTRILWTLLVLGLLSMAKSVWLVDLSDEVAWTSSTQQLAFFSPTTRAWQFIAGILLAAALPPRDEAATSAAARISTWIHGLAVFTALAVLAHASLYYDGDTPFPGAASIAPTAATLLLLLSARYVSATRALLCNRPMQRIGDWSYSIYLIHWPLIVFAHALWPESLVAGSLAALAAFPLAAASWRWLENRWRTHGSVLRGTVLLAIVCVGAPISAAFVAGEVRTLAMERRADVIGACPSDICVMLDPTANTDAHDERREVVIVGDSHAMSLEHVLPTILAPYSIDVTSLARVGCPFLVGTSGLPNRNCPAWQSETLQSILLKSPDAVIVAGYTTGRATRLSRGRHRESHMHDEQGNRARTDEEALRFYSRGLGALAAELASADIPLLVISTVPDYSQKPFERISASALLRDREKLRSTPQSRDSAAARNAPFLEAERVLAAQYPGQVLVLDPLPYLCTDTCSQVREGRLLYEDEDHLTPEGAWLVLEGTVPLLLQLLDSTH